MTDEADHYTIMRMGELLAGVAIALKGPEEAMKRHGYQDLPQLVQALVFEVEILKKQVADYAAMYDPLKAMVDDMGNTEPDAWLLVKDGKPVNAFIDTSEEFDEYWKNKGYTTEPLFSAHR